MYVQSLYHVLENNSTTAADGEVISDVLSAVKASAPARLKVAGINNLFRAICNGKRGKQVGFRTRRAEAYLMSDAAAAIHK